MDEDAVERARRRLTALRRGAGESDLAAALERARVQLESFAQSTAELEASLPERVSSALHDSLASEVLPVARHLAEVRGLSAQTIRRLEGLAGDLAAERRARVEDLELLVDLISSGWAGIERRLDRIERMLEARPAPGPLLRLEERRMLPGEP